MIHYLEATPPSCHVCSHATRHVGLEAHPDKEKVDVLTFQCPNCSNYETAELPAGQFLKPVATSGDGTPEK